MRYRLSIAARAKRDLTALPAKVVDVVWAFMNGPLLDNPRRVGKPLQVPFDGLWVARRGAYRIKYSIDDERVIVEVVAVTGRADAYRP